LEFFFSPLPGLPTKISEKDATSQKLVIINEWIGRFWQDLVSAYVFGVFSASILLCSPCIELMIKGIALRDNKELYQKIKGKTGFNINLLAKNYEKEFKPIEKQLREIQKSRGNVIAHGINIIEKKAEREELWKILMHEMNWHQKKPLPELGGYKILEFKNLAKNTIELTVEVLDYLQRIYLKNQEDDTRGAWEE